MGWIVFIVLTVVIMIIAWIGNAVADKTTDAIRNSAVRKENETNPEKSEPLSSRFNKMTENK